MLEGNAQDEVRQQKIRMMFQKRAEEVKRECEIYNDELNAKYAIIMKKAYLANLTSALPIKNGKYHPPARNDSKSTTNKEIQRALSYVKAEEGVGNALHEYGVTNLEDILELNIGDLIETGMTLMQVHQLT